MKQYNRIMLGEHGKYLQKCLDGKYIGTDFLKDVDLSTNQRDGSFGLLWTNPDVDVLSFESFFVSLHCWNGFGG